MSSNVNRNFLESSKKFPLFHSMRCVTRGNFLRGWNFVGILNFFCKRSRFYLLILIVLLCSGTSSFMMSFPWIFLFFKVCSTTRTSSLVFPSPHTFYSLCAHPCTWLTSTAWKTCQYPPLGDMKMMQITSLAQYTVILLKYVIFARISLFIYVFFKQKYFGSEHGKKISRKRALYNDK